ncbi:unnamed protein product [Soboliphyme baturini]|uniref:Doublecortin domain-containing protein n=1 Tax=Soboliphyme baturini TaxID=241478 RepID=A0A183J864_9BILA|nr:unnamed protein product [Soboliphyme baturini]
MSRNRRSSCLVFSTMRLAVKFVMKCHINIYFLQFRRSIGIFPSTCVARVYSNERVMQVLQNVNLWDGTKSLRLYRDQVVFAESEEPDGLVPIRTEKDHRINCPATYLICLN